jgi:SAM-dependent methyltransferase
MRPAAPILATLLYDLASRAERQTLLAKVSTGRDAHDSRPEFEPVSSGPSGGDPMTDYLQRGFDLDDPDTAAAFDELSFWSARFGAFLFEHLHLEAGLTILDLGCGCGFPLHELAQVHGASSHVVGVDLWGAALTRAALKRRVLGLDHVDLVKADAARLPFRSGCFDLVVSHLGINNFAAPEAALDECARVLRPGGRLVLTTNPVGHMREFYTEFRRTLRELGLAARLARVAANEAHRGTSRALSATLRSRGFDVSRILVRPFRMRYLDGGTFLRHHLTRIGFLDGWRAAVDPSEEVRVFSALEARLDARARREGALVLRVPMLYLEARRRDSSGSAAKEKPMPATASRKRARIEKSPARKRGAAQKRGVTRKRAAAPGSSTAPKAGPTARRSAAPPRASAARPRARKAADIGDPAVLAKTGKTQAQWFTLLDRAGAASWPHRDIAAHLHDAHDCPSWWSQMITVAYERERGLRQRHQTASGFSVTCSRTIAAPVATLYAAWAEPRRRSRWLPEKNLEVRTATPERSMRITWSDATSVEVGFYPKSAGKAQVAVQHSKLPDARAVERLRAYWSARLDALREQIEA